MTNAMAQFLSAREEIQVTWARDMWQKLQLRHELTGIGRDISLMTKQLTRGHKERSELYAQLLQLRTLIDDQLNPLLANNAVADEGPALVEEPPAAITGESLASASDDVADSVVLLEMIEQLQEQMQQQWDFLQTHLPGSIPLPTEDAPAAVPALTNGHQSSVHNGGDQFSNDEALDRATFAITTGSTTIGSQEPCSDAETNGDAETTSSNVNYRRLHKLLAAGKWSEADRETTRLMLKVAGRSPASWLRIEDIENFPAGDLQAIDRLWVAYSQDQFGFSVQKRLWLDIIDDSTSQVEAWCQFGDRLGWLSKKKMGAGLSSPAGHLPSCSSVGVWWSSGLFLQVLETCSL